MIDKDRLQSEVISFLRFPLIVAVLLIHTNLGNVIINGINCTDGYNIPVYDNLRFFISGIIGDIAVPLFYFISGFLFFYKTELFTSKVYFQKLRKRGKTLLIPYLFWNLVVVILFLLTQTFLSNLTSGRNLLITDYTWINWLKAFWNGNVPGDNYPINYPLWFIRDLMITVLFSPIIYYLVKSFKHYILVLLAIFWLFDIRLPIDGFSTTAFFFFASGTYFSIFRKNFVTIFSSSISYLMGGYLITILLNWYFSEFAWSVYIHRVCILIGLPVVISLVACCISKQHWQMPASLTNSSFFIFVYHGMPLAFVMKGLCKYIQPQADLSFSLIYLLSPIITIAIGLIIYNLLVRYLPRFTAFITGARS